MQKWEYTTLIAQTGYDLDILGVVLMLNNRGVENALEKKWSINSALQQLGDDGWELVNVIRYSGELDTRFTTTAYYFKRPKI